MSVKQTLKDIRLVGLEITHRPEIIDMTRDEAEQVILAHYTPKPLYTREVKLQPLDRNNYNLSIIIPAYNCAGYIGKCLDTLMHQNTKYSYEIIIVNDGSTDYTEDVIKAFKSPLIHFINQPNGGAAMARNTGLFHATGEYVCFVDGDDYLEPDYIERLLSEAYSSNADIVKCGYYMYQAETPEDIGEKILKKPIVLEGDPTEKLVGYDGFIWDMIERRSLWEGYAFPEKWWFEDMITKLILMRKCRKFVYIAEPLYHYAIIETSLSRSAWKSSDIQGIDQLWLVREIIERADEFGLQNMAEQYPLILGELGRMLFYRTGKLPEKIRKAIFMEAACLTDIYREKSMDIQLATQMQKKLNKAFAERDFALWEIVSLKG